MIYGKSEKWGLPAIKMAAFTRKNVDASNHNGDAMRYMFPPTNIDISQERE